MPRRASSLRADSLPAVNSRISWGSSLKTRKGFSSANCFFASSQSAGTRLPHISIASMYCWRLRAYWRSISGSTFACSVFSREESPPELQAPSGRRRRAKAATRRIIDINIATYWTVLPGGLLLRRDLFDPFANQLPQGLPLFRDAVLFL